MGHRRPRTISLFDPILHQRLQCGGHCIRYHQYSSANLDVVSYQNLSKWIDNVREVRGDEALILVMGNKQDLEDERVVPNSDAKEHLKGLGLTFMEVSAKTGHNVK